MRGGRLSSVLFTVSHQRGVLYTWHIEPQQHSSQQICQVLMLQHSFLTLLGSDSGYCGWTPLHPPTPSSRAYTKRMMGPNGTCRCLAIPPVKVSSVDAGLQWASNRVSSSLNVRLKEISIQLSYSVHTHLEYQGHIYIKQNIRAKDKEEMASIILSCLETIQIHVIQ